MTHIVLALSFGKPSTFPSNTRIASIAKSISFEQGVAIFADETIPLEKDDESVFYFGAPADKHESTLSLALKMAEAAVNRRCVQIIVVTAPDYMERAKRDVRACLRERRSLCEVSDWRDYSDSSNEHFNWYGNKSSQWWTKYRTLFLLREWILLEMPFWLYKKISA